MSKGISKMQVAIIEILERNKGSMTPNKILNAVLLQTEYNPTFENLCRALRSLYKRGLLKRTVTHYVNPSAHGFRYFTLKQYEDWNKLFIAKLDATGKK